MIGKAALFVSGAVVGLATAWAVAAVIVFRQDGGWEVTP